MKTSIKTLILTLALGSTAAFANTDDKTKTDTKKALPAQNVIVETPAPQSNKTVNAYNQYSPAQKAALVELKLAK